MSDTFDNVNRNRYYGIRKGDTVKLSFSKNPEQEAQVVGYGFLDNNCVTVQYEENKPFDWCAEWCTIVKKVEDKA